MKLHHTVNRILDGQAEGIAKLIEVEGIIPQVPDEYKDLVPETIRNLPVVWLAEGIWQGWEFPVFEVDSKDLNKDKLYPVLETPAWWVYQGHIPASVLSRMQIPSYV